MNARIKTRVNAVEHAFTIIMGWPYAYDGQPNDRPDAIALNAFSLELEREFDGYTAWWADGTWEGRRETARVFYITTDKEIDEALHVLDDLLEDYGAALNTRWVHVDNWSRRVFHREIEKAEVRAKVEPCAEQARRSIGEVFNAHTGDWPRADRSRDEMLRSAHEMPMPDHYRVLGPDMETIKHSCETGVLEELKSALDQARREGSSRMISIDVSPVYRPRAIAPAQGSSISSREPQVIDYEALDSEFS